MREFSSIEKQLFELEKKLLEPEVRSSKAELCKLLAESFFEFGSSGKVLYKDENINKIQLSEVQMSLSDFEIHPLSEEIILTTYKIYNKLNQQSSLRSSIWKLVDGHWKMHFHQGTKIPFSNSDRH